MNKSTYSREYTAVRKALRDMRQEAGLTQTELADILDREQSFVWRIEAGERRLDLVEFHWVCRVLGRDAAEVYSRLIEEFKAVDPASSSAKGVSGKTSSRKKARIRSKAKKKV